MRIQLTLASSRRGTSGGLSWIQLTLASSRPGTVLLTLATVHFRLVTNFRRIWGGSYNMISIVLLNHSLLASPPNFTRRVFREPSSAERLALTVNFWST